MRPKEILIDPIPIDADGIAAVQTATAAGAITLAGALTTDGVFKADYPRKIGVISSGDDSGVTITVTGTDHDNKAITEDITGTTGGAATTDTTLYFDTVTEISLDGAAAANISAGTVDEFCTNTIPLETSNGDPATISLENITGTFDVSVEQTMSRIQYSDIEYHAVGATLTNATTSVVDDIDNHASGVRLVGNSYTSGAELTMVINQDRRF